MSCKRFLSLLVIRFCFPAINYLCLRILFFFILFISLFLSIRHSLLIIDHIFFSLRPPRSETHGKDSFANLNCGQVATCLAIFAFCFGRSDRAYTINLSFSKHSTQSLNLLFKRDLHLLKFVVALVAIPRQLFIFATKRSHVINYFINLYSSLGQYMCVSVTHYCQYKFYLSNCV